MAADVVILRAGAAYNVLPRMADALAEGFAAQGVRATLAVVRADDVRQVIEGHLAERPGAWVVGFGSIAINLADEEGRSIYDREGCGFIGWDVDHPVYQFDRFKAPLARRMQVCASPSHLEFARRVIGTCSHGLTLLPGVAEVSADPAPLADRPIHVMAAMSWLGEPEVWWADWKGQPAYALVEAIVARLLADTRVDLLAAYDAACADLGVEVTFDAPMSRLMADIARFVRRYDRVRLAQAMAALDVPRVICGDGWRDRLGERPNLHFADDLDVENIATLYGRSRAVVNFNASNGGSERAVTAMATGALVVSDHGPLLDAELGASGALRLFDRRQPETLGATVMAALCAPDAQDAAERGRTVIAERHLWRHKAAALMEAMGEVDRQASPLAA